jgi:hypothetical protein
MHHASGDFFIDHMVILANSPAPAPYRVAKDLVLTWLKDIAGR